MDVKTEADADSMILEYPHDDKPAVGMLIHSFVGVTPFHLIAFHLTFKSKLKTNSDSDIKANSNSHSNSGVFRIWQRGAMASVQSASL